MTFFLVITRFCFAENSRDTKWLLCKRYFFKILPPFKNFFRGPVNNNKKLFNSWEILCFSQSNVKSLPKLNNKYQL